MTRISGLLCGISLIFLATLLFILQVPQELRAQVIWKPGVYLGKDVSSMTDEELEENIKDAAKNYLWWKKAAEKKGKTKSHRAELYRKGLDELMYVVKLRKLRASKRIPKARTPEERYRTREEYLRLNKLEDICWQSLNPQKSGWIMTMDDINEAIQEDGLKNLNPVTFLKNMAIKKCEKSFLSYMERKGVPEPIAREQWELLSGKGATKIKTPIEHAAEYLEDKLVDKTRELLDAKAYEKGFIRKRFTKRALDKVNIIAMASEVFLAAERAYLYSQSNYEDLIAQVNKLREKGLSDEEIVKWYNDSEFRKKIRKQALEQNRIKNEMLKKQANEKAIAAYKYHLALRHAKRTIAEARGVAPDDISGQEAERYLNEGEYRKKVDTRVYRLREARRTLALAKMKPAYKISREELDRFLEDPEFRKLSLKQARENSLRMQQMRKKGQSEAGLANTGGQSTIDRDVPTEIEQDSNPDHIANNQRRVQEILDSIPTPPVVETPEMKKLSDMVDKITSNTPPPKGIKGLQNHPVFKKFSGSQN